MNQIFVSTPYRRSITVLETNLLKLLENGRDEFSGKHTSQQNTETADHGPQKERGLFFQGNKNILLNQNIEKGWDDTFSKYKYMRYIFEERVKDRRKTVVVINANFNGQLRKQKPERKFRLERDSNL